VGPLGFEPRIACAPGRYPILESPVISQEHRFSEDLSKLDDDPAYQEYQAKVNKTIAEAKSNGLTENTLRSIIYTLKVLNKETDLMNPEAVKTYISAMKRTDPKSSKREINHARAESPLSERAFKLKSETEHKTRLRNLGY
jgi:hypothetical protein